MKRVQVKDIIGSSFNQTYSSIKLSYTYERSVFDALLSISLATKINHLDDIMAANVPSVKNELMFDALLLESLPYSKPSVRKRALDALILLACTKAENRDTLVSTLEFPEWIVLLLIRTKTREQNEEDIIKVGIDLLDILLHHALRASRDGAFVLEILSRSFKTSGEANAKAIEQKVLTNLLSFVFKELRGFNKLGMSENSLIMRDKRLKLLSVVDEHLHRIGEIDSEVSDEDSRRWLICTREFAAFLVPQQIYQRVALVVIFLQRRDGICTNLCKVKREGVYGICRRLGRKRLKKASVVQTMFRN